MAKFPEPPTPAELAASAAPDVARITAGTLLWRVYFRAGRHPGPWHRFRSHGPVASGRFDHHDARSPGPSRAILYAAREYATCLAEVFQDTRVIDRQHGAPWLVAFRTAADLDLLDATGAWPTRAGGSMALHTGPRPRAQRWARVIHAAWPALHGILYPSSMHANRPALALFERAQPAMPAHPEFHRALTDPPLLGPIASAAARLGYAVV